MNTSLLYNIALEQLDDKDVKEFSDTGKKYILKELPSPSKKIFCLNDQTAILVDHHWTITQNTTFVSVSNEQTATTSHHTLRFKIETNGTQTHFTVHFYYIFDQIVDMKHHYLTSDEQTMKLTPESSRELLSFSLQIITPLVYNLKKHQDSQIYKHTKIDQDYEEHLNKLSLNWSDDEEFQKHKTLYIDTLQGRINNLVKLNAYLNKPKKALLNILTGIKKIAQSHQPPAHQIQDSKPVEQPQSKPSTTQAPTICLKKKKKKKKKKQNDSPTWFLKKLGHIRCDHTKAAQSDKKIMMVEHLAKAIKHLDKIRVKQTQRDEYKDAFIIMESQTIDLINSHFRAFHTLDQASIEQLQETMMYVNGFEDKIIVENAILCKVIQAESSANIITADLLKKLLPIFEQTTLSIFSFEGKQHTLLEWCIVSQAPNCFEALLEYGFSPYSFESATSPLFDTLHNMDECSLEYRCSILTANTNQPGIKFQDLFKSIAIQQTPQNADAINLIWEISESASKAKRIRYRSRSKIPNIREANLIKHARPSLVIKLKTNVPLLETIKAYNDEELRFERLIQEKKWPRSPLQNSSLLLENIDKDSSDDIIIAVTQNHYEKLSSKLQYTNDLIELKSIRGFQANSQNPIFASLKLLKSFQKYIQQIESTYTEKLIHSLSQDDKLLKEYLSLLYPDQHISIVKENTKNQLSDSEQSTIDSIRSAYPSLLPSKEDEAKLNKMITDNQQFLNDAFQYLEGSEEDVDGKLPAKPKTETYGEHQGSEHGEKSLISMSTHSQSLFKRNTEEASTEYTEADDAKLPAEIKSRDKSLCS